MPTQKQGTPSERLRKRAKGGKFGRPLTKKELKEKGIIFKKKKKTSRIRSSVGGSMRKLIRSPLTKMLRKRTR